MRSAGKIATWTIGLGLLCYLAFDRFSRATELKAPLGARDVLRKLLSETSPSDVALLLLALACIAAATAGYWWPQLSTFFVAATTSKSATPPVVSPQAPPPGKPLRSSGPPEVMAPRHVGRPRPAGPAGPVPVLNADRQAPGDQSAPAGALLTGASLATRRRALSELGAHIDGPVAALLDLGLGLRAMRHDGQAAALLDAARGFRERLKICSAAQEAILAKYRASTMCSRSPIGTISPMSWGLPSMPT